MTELLCPLCFLQAVNTALHLEWKRPCGQAGKLVHFVLIGLLDRYVNSCPNREVKHCTWEQMMPGFFLTRSMCPGKGHVNLATMAEGQISGMPHSAGIRLLFSAHSEPQLKLFFKTSVLYLRCLMRYWDTRADAWEMWRRSLQPLFPGNRDRTQGNGFKLHQGRFRPVLGNNSSQKEW